MGSPQAMTDDAPIPEKTRRMGEPKYWWQLSGYSVTTLKAAKRDLAAFRTNESVAVGLAATAPSIATIKDREANRAALQSLLGWLQRASPELIAALGIKL